MPTLLTIDWNETFLPRLAGQLVPARVAARWARRAPEIARKS